MSFLIFFSSLYGANTWVYITHNTSFLPLFLFLSHQLTHTRTQLPSPLSPTLRLLPTPSSNSPARTWPPFRGCHRNLVERRLRGDESVFQKTANFLAPLCQARKDFGHYFMEKDRVLPATSPIKKIFAWVPAAEKEPRLPY